MRDNLPKMLRAAAKEWREENKVVATGATRYDAALDEAADAIEELSKPKWIPVTERLPEDRQSVLVHRDDGGIFIFEYFTTSPTDECWIDDHLNVYSAYCVTHWKPLPEPPKEEAT